ncbi:MAG: hypothetical protein AAF092_16185 [Pseudomonadota bacterium]
MITDAQINEYMAGTASEALASQIEAEAAADEVLQSRLVAADPFTGKVAGAFGHLRPPQMPKITPRKSNWHTSHVAAITVFALTIGMTGGLFLSRDAGSTTKSWVSAVADYQLLYQPATVSVLSPEAGELYVQLRRAGDFIGADLERIANTDLEGATLLRAQVLGLGGRPIIQMVYQLADGTPLALCVTRRGADAQPSLGFTISDLSASRWQTADHDFVLISDMPLRELAPLSRLARDLTEAI